MQLIAASLAGLPTLSHNAAAWRPPVHREPLAQTLGAVDRKVPHPSGNYANGPAPATDSSFQRGGLPACLPAQALARAFALQGLELARRLHDAAAVSRALRDVGSALVLAGDLVRAEEVRREAVEAAERSGDQHELAINLSNLGDLALQREDYGSARALFEEPLADARALTPPLPEALFVATYNAGVAAGQLGDIAAGELLVREALGTRAPARLAEGPAASFAALASASERRGDLPRAVRLVGAMAAALEAGRIATSAVERSQSRGSRCVRGRSSRRRRSI